MDPAEEERVRRIKAKLKRKPLRPNQRRKCRIEQWNGPPTKEQIEELVHDGFLPEWDNSHFKSSWKEIFPSEETEEVTVFKFFYEVGFGLPACNFCCRLLGYYGVDLCHLNPYSILHISIFIHLCEAYLEIDPHWALFRHFSDERD